MRIGNRVLPLSAAAALLVAMAMLSGCNDEPPPAGPKTTGTAAAVTGFGCGAKLEAALQLVQPERLGMTSDAETAESRLNTWLKACGGEIDAAGPPGEAIEALLEPVLSPTGMNRLTADRFAPGDAEHVRNSKLHKATATLALDSPGSELERVVELFHYCVRNVALHTSPAERLPLDPYQILLFGRGSAEDVAWVFADVLRQLQIDAVILRPAQGSTGGESQQSADDRWLIGVLLDSQVYLFDPRLGTPVPAAADSGRTPTVQQPASLADVLKDDGLLRKLDAADSEPYPFTAEDLSKLTVEVVGTRSLWSSSMARLQATLSGERSMVVYDGLQDFGDAPGLIQRVAEHGGDVWSKDDVAVWPYPQRQLQVARQLDDAQRQRLEQLELPLDAPVQVEQDVVAGVVRIGRPERWHVETRTTYLMGDHEAAVRNYQSLRIRLVTSARLPLPAEIRAMHARAADDAAYWIGLCQFEQGHFEPAVATFRDYIRRYENQPDAAWTAHCRLMLGWSLAETGDWDDALFELREEGATPEPLAARRRFWIARWKAAEAAAGS